MTRMTPQLKSPAHDATKPDFLFSYATGTTTTKRLTLNFLFLTAKGAENAKIFLATHTDR